MSLKYDKLHYIYDFTNELQSSDDLLSCLSSFPEIGSIGDREQLSTLVYRILQLDKPLLIHADGETGKTFFLQSLAGSLGETHETILLDCFGGGAYRAPENGRHLPNPVRVKSLAFI